MATQRERHFNAFSQFTEIHNKITNHKTPRAKHCMWKIFHNLCEKIFSKVFERANKMTLVGK